MVRSEPPPGTPISDWLPTPPFHQRRYAWKSRGRATLVPLAQSGVALRLPPHSRLAYPENQLASKLVKWEYASVKTTLELPDDLIRAMKIRALDEGRKLKDMAAELIRRGLEQPALPAPTRRQVKLPLIVAEPGAPAFSMTGEDIDRVLAEGEAEGLHDPS